MAGNVTFHKFNRGLISRLGLGRTDLDRINLSAEVQTNFIPRVLGSMMLRPGMQFIGAIDKPNRLIPFVFRSDDKAILEITDSHMRIWIDDTPVTRSVPISSIVNPQFNTNLVGWTVADDPGASTVWTNASDPAAGYAALRGNVFDRARMRQMVSAPAGEQHIGIGIARGPVYLKVGSSARGADYFAEKRLRTGHYSLAITTTGSFYLEFSAETEYPALVDFAMSEASGNLSISTIWRSTDLPNLRWTQSNDVIFVACRDRRPQRIERYSKTSWAVVDYTADDGPFGNINTSKNRLAPSGLAGEITITSDQQMFSPTHAGALVKITSIGQDVRATFTGPDQASDYIRISGVGTGRTITINITAATLGTPISVQRSVGEPGSWENVPGLTFGAPASQTYVDGLDNQIVFYRLSGTGSATVPTVGELLFAGGGITGIARIALAYSSTAVSATVLTHMGSTAASDLWYIGDWSDRDGWPTSVTMHEGRVFWAGKSKLWGSVSDSFESFDTESTTLGDAGPINLTIARGANEVIEWLASLTRLLMGTPLQIMQAKTSSLEEPLTPTNFALRDVASRGSASVDAVRIDQRLLFTHTSKTRVMEIAPSVSQLDYECTDRSVLIPEIGEPAIVASSVQRQPDTRAHFVRSDGTVALYVSDPLENVQCWVDLETDGKVEDIAVLPGPVEDIVYYSVAREVNGSTRRYLERMALESQARGGPTNCIADSFKIFETNAPHTTVTGLDHLIGRTVSVWGATDDQGLHVVSAAGRVTLGQPSTTTVVGLPYVGKYVSSKLAYAAASGGSALTARKKISQLGLVLADTHARGLRYGPSTDVLQNMPLIENSQRVSSGYMWSAYDNDAVLFPGSWMTDSRLYLLAESPRPVTVLATIFGIDTREKVV